jgi:DNA-binding response OmpR family regulator
VGASLTEAPDRIIAAESPALIDCALWCVHGRSALSFPDVSMRILIVDDEVQIRVGLVRLLSKRGFPSDQASSVAEARALLGEKQYDAALLDWQLPDGTGLDVCRLIRAAYPSIHVIMLTARDESAERLRAFDAGVDDYLVKQSVDIEEIGARLRAVARRKMAPRSA